MNLPFRIMRSSIAVLLAVLTAGSTSIMAMGQPAASAANTETLASSAPPSGNSDAKTGKIYNEYYLTYGSARVSDAVLGELYLNLDLELTYALRSTDDRKTYSLSKVYEMSKDPESCFCGVFDYEKDGSKYNAYDEISAFYEENKNDDGYAMVDESIIPALSQVASKLPVTGSKELWDSLCFYSEAEEGTVEFTEDDVFGDITLLYGNEDLKDEDAFVLLIMGDGFGANERETLYEKAKAFAEYMMNTSPFSDFGDAVKIYGMSVDSKDSGISADVDDAKEAEDAQKDTYFGTYFWADGSMERLIGVSTLGLLKLNKITRFYADRYCVDFSGLLVNSYRYGGSGGTYCTCSLNESANEIFIHEIGHTIANLADEYYAGNSYFGTHPNMTNQSKIANLPWADFYGLDGVGKFAYTDNMTQQPVTYQGTLWYKPCSMTCKMEKLNDVLEDGTMVPVEFCPVCKEALRAAICNYSNVTELYFQPYNRVFKDDGLEYRLSAPSAEGESYNILQYALLRRGENISSLADVDSSRVSVKYYDESGNEIGVPAEAGTYRVYAEFSGDDTYEPRTIEFEYTIEKFAMERGFISMVEALKTETDFGVIYTGIGEALAAYEDINQDDSAVAEAKASLDEIIASFNETVKESNADNTAALSVTSNIMATGCDIALIGAVLAFIIRKILGV